MQRVYVVELTGSPKSTTDVAPPRIHFQTSLSPAPPPFFSNSSDLLAAVDCVQPVSGAAPQCGSGVDVGVMVGVCVKVDVTVGVSVTVGVGVTVGVAVA